MTSIKFVTGDGTGDYNCDGSADQDEINKALSWAAANPGSQVHLKGPFTYDITDQILVGSSTIFSGDSTAKLRLNDSCLWPGAKSVIGQIGGWGTATHDVEIFGFELDLNQAHLYQPDTGRIHGKGYYNSLFFKGTESNPCYNINVHDVYWHDGLGDGVRIEYGKNVNVQNCDFRDLMHASIYLIDVDTITVENNYIEAITNAGIRLDNCRVAVARNNTITDFIGVTNAPKGGAWGFQIANEPLSTGNISLTQSIEVYNNDISVGASGIAIEDISRTSLINQSVYVHHNRITGCGKTNWASYFAGIHINAWGDGLSIENNYIDGNYRAGILVVNASYTGAKAIIRGNNIINTVKAGTDGGFGIWNKVPGSLTVISESNFLSNNIAGNYSGVTPGSMAVETLPESTIMTELPAGPTEAYQVIINCSDTEAERFIKGIIQKYYTYQKV